MILKRKTQQANGWLRSLMKFYWTRCSSATPSSSPGASANTSAPSPRFQQASPTESPRASPPDFRMWDLSIQTLHQSRVPHIWRAHCAVKSRHTLYTLASAGSEEKVKKSLSVCHLRGLCPQRSVTGKWTVFDILTRVEEAEAGSAGEQPARNTRPDSSYRCVHSGMTLAFKTTFEVFPGVGPDNSLERLTERSVRLVTDQPSNVHELLLPLLE